MGAPAVPFTPPVPEPVAEIGQRIAALQQELSALRRQLPAEPVADFALAGPDGPVALSSLLADRPDLLVVHNMGRGCAYCTLWADGFNGVVDHLRDRAGFVVVSPDPPDVQAAFAQGRGWRFPMLSDPDGAFTRAMGFLHGDDEHWPGVSAFRRTDDGTIVRTGADVFGPGDVYNAPWHLFDLLQGGAGGWWPMLDYAEPRPTG